MIKKNLIFFFILFVFSCSNVEFVIKDNTQQEQLKNNIALVSDTNVEEVFLRELYSYFGNSKNHEFVLLVSFTEKKENRIVKQNQAAQRVDYTLTASYTLFYKNRECKIFSKKISTRFSFTPKSAGYNFGTDRSFEKLYNQSVKKNIKNFDNLAPFQTTCLQ